MEFQNALLDDFADTYAWADCTIPIIVRRHNASDDFWNMTAAFGRTSPHIVWFIEQVEKECLIVGKCLA